MSDTMPLPSSNAKTDLRALNAFVTQNSDLERLEGILAQFNLFEAIGVVHHELRHSDLLAFLLNPSQNHGLADAFVKRFLQEVSPDDYTEGSFEAVDVRREWSHIDILLLNERQRFVLLIENKIWTGQHSDQLKRYYDEVQREWPDYDILALYLTPKGDEPNHPYYLAIDYGVVCRVVEAVSVNLQGRLDPGVYLLLTHYAQMLKRHIMTDTEVADLCHSIYAKHQQALDLIFEHKPDIRAILGNIAVRLITNDPDNWFYYSERGPSWLNCRPTAWKGNRFLDHILFCQLTFSNTQLTFTINIWNGDGNDFKERLQLWEMAKRFGWPAKKLRSGNNQTEIYKFIVFNSSSNNSDDADLETIIEQNWAAFLDQHYPAIEASLSFEKWLWDESAVPPPLPVSRPGINEVVKGLIDAETDFLKYRSKGGHYVNFDLHEWDKSALYRGERTDHSWLLYFSFLSLPESLTVGLWVGPGDATDRERLRDMAQAHRLIGSPTKLKGKWCSLSTIPILSTSDYAKTQEEAELLITEKWAAFLRDELPRMAQAVRDEPWLWEMP